MVYEVLERATRVGLPSIFFFAKQLHSVFALNPFISVYLSYWFVTTIVTAILYMPLLHQVQHFKLLIEVVWSNEYSWNKVGPPRRTRSQKG